MEKPNFYSILPAYVRYDKNLSPVAKLLFSEITALSNKEGYCFASNGYFANLYDLSEVRISQLINQLEKKGYIRIEILKDQGNLRKIYIKDVEYFEKGGIKKNFNRGIKKNFNNNITSINNNLLFKDNKLAKAKKQYGNQLINFVLEEFKIRKGFYPTDKKPRQRAWNLVQKVNTFIKKNPNLPEIVNTPEKFIKKYFDYLKKKDYFGYIENLDTVVRKVEIYFGLIEKTLKNQKIVNSLENKKENQLQNESEENYQKYQEAKKKLLEKFKI